MCTGEAFGFDAASQLVLANAASTTNGAINPDTGSVATYTINPDGTLTAVSGPVTDGQTAPCWITAVQGFDYVANTGSGTLSQYSVSTSGTVTLVQATAASGSPARPTSPQRAASSTT
jgi:6-phosphogluconolactonase (cycloisomerase 2 family)